MGCVDEKPKPAEATTAAAPTAAAPTAKSTEKKRLT